MSICIRTHLAFSYMVLLTKGVVDDFKQSKVAGCYTVHTKLHHHSLEEARSDGMRNKQTDSMSQMCVT